MRTKNIKKFLGMICIMLCLCSISVPCYAAAFSPSGPMYMEGITTLRCFTEVSNGKITGQAILSGKRSVEKCKMSLTIERKDGNKWVSVGTWEKNADGRNLSMTQNVTTKAGNTYRAKATVTVWFNGKTETKTILSNETKV